MCGIAGILGNSSSFTKDDLTQLRAGIAYRGIDNKGHEYGDKYCLFHSRLSILDLRDVSNQPMQSNCGRYSIVFNGEVYNHRELTSLFSLGTLETNSDTEVLLKALVKMGVEEVLPYISGMFAFCFVDKLMQKAYLARDNNGEKPLYYISSEDSLIFASDLSSFSSSLRGEISNSSLKTFTHLNYVGGNQTIFTNVRKLESSSFLALDYSTDSVRLKQFDWEPNWNYFNSVVDGRLDRALNLSVNSMLSADVPIGTFLSGGIDSSLVTALATSNSRSQINTFSVGFSSKSHNEATYAKEIAKILDTNHHEVYLTSKDLASAVETMPLVYTEPFADSSMLPTYLINREAGKSFRVMLSGDGGDELFYGYERYKYLDLFMSNRGVIGYSRPLLKLVLGFIEKSGIEGSVVGRLRRNLPKIIDNNLYGLNEKDLYYYLMSNFNSQELTNGSSLNFPRGTNLNRLNAKSMRKIDLVNYMIDDILVKVDRAAMYNNVEGRIPLLDNHVKSVVYGMGDKTNNITNRKSHLKNILGEHLDLKLFDRPKMGFGIPLSQMLRNDLKELALDSLNTSFFDNFSEVYKTNVAVRLVNDFFKGTDGSEYLIWNLLMFKLWNDQWGN